MCDFFKFACRVSAQCPIAQVLACIINTKFSCLASKKTGVKYGTRQPKQANKRSHKTTTRYERATHSYVCSYPKRFLENGQAVCGASIPALLCQNLPVNLTVTKGPSIETSSQFPVIPISRFSALFPKMVPKICCFAPCMHQLALLWLDCR